MTANQFAEECEKRLLAPAIALENEAIRKALAKRDDAKVVALLESEF